MHIHDRLPRTRVLALFLGAALASSAAALLQPRPCPQSLPTDLSDTLERARLEEDLVNAETSALMFAECRSVMTAPGAEATR